MDSRHYVIRGGVEGRERLRILARVMQPTTLESIADAVLAEGLASTPEIETTLAALYDFARDPSTVVSLPRIVQAWGSRPEA